MNKKAVGAQIFVYIIAVVTLGIVFLFGYMAISSIVTEGENVAQAKFSNDLLRTVNKIRTSYGRSETIHLNIPTDVKQVCFIDLKYGYDQGATGSGKICNSGSDNYLPILCDSWENKEYINVFFVTGSLELPLQTYLGDRSKCSLDLEDGCIADTSYIQISDAPHYSCINATGGFVTFRMTGRGGKVTIEP